MKRVKPFLAGMTAIFLLPIAISQVQAAQSEIHVLDDAPLTTASVSKIASNLKNQSFYNIEVTGTAGPFVEAEACKRTTHFYLQMNDNGKILQKTRLGECSGDVLSATTSSKEAEKATNAHASALGIGNEKSTAKVVRVSNTRQSVEIYPSPRNTKNGISRSAMLRKKGYSHIYVPRNRSLGVMACKNGKEYAFNVMSDNITKWHQMRSRRQAFGKCFGYGKQIRNRQQLVNIMRRHGDTRIKVVRGSLPMFEAYSCLQGKRQHVKINRWGNNNTRIVGKCR